MAENKDSLTPLKDILDGLFSQGGLPLNPEDGKIWQIWDSIVGEIIAGHSRPSWIKNGVLNVAVSDPIWSQELQFHAEEIRGRINRELGREAVSRIVFKVGSI